MYTLKLALLALAATPSASFFFNTPSALSATTHAKVIPAARNQLNFAAGEKNKMPTLLKAKATDSAEEVLYKNIQVTGNNIEVTPAMKEYVLKKIGKVLAKQHLEEAILKVGSLK